MYTHHEITDFFIGLLAVLESENKMHPIQVKAFHKYAEEYFTYYAEDSEGKDVE